ncbi:HET domain-containing protein [Rutstroemia sp. NJR-2017a BBW]|nr:HET domain-containing protein [Rutstroemia sp. NJR-2017a BBW]
MHLLSWEVLYGREDKLKIRLERDANVVNYAILSHRWGNPEDEVSFEDMLNGRQEGKKGYMKLIGCCKQAQKDGLRYVWIDTCCINKASSAELSEAITSMFTYYERSKVCYVFMENLYSSSFSRSAWFTRGWTLQELIAPLRVKFFDSSWSFLGLKTDELLCPVIESITGIDSTVLNIPATARLVSISKKMSWAARRKTTRIEDVAYSLMGIFGVYMSPLYGEGHHAFIRLQEAIMRTSNDHTIFAWTSPPIIPLTSGLELVSTMLALSPDQFEYSAAFRPIPHDEHNKVFTASGIKLDYVITNAGLAIRLPLLEIPEFEGLYAAFLACTESEDRIPSAILLRTTAETPAGYFWRTNCNQGPIERSQRRWFSTSGREDIDSNDLYVIPRFSSVSGDNIEPPWIRVDTAKTQYENAGNTSSRTKKNSLAIDTAVLSSLDYAPDPYFRELAFLRQAHQMISTNQADQLVNMIKTRQRFPKTLPWARNRNFCGRAFVLQELRDVFFPSDRNLKSQSGGLTGYTISGMGGIGKTQVALEFAHYCIENHLFNVVIWIDATTSMSIHAGFQRTASELKLTEQGAPSHTIVSEVLRWLSDFDQHSNILSGSSAPSAQWLLVFDNADDASLLPDFLPSTGPGCVLVTSRDPNAWYLFDFEKIYLEPFTIQESSELFRHLTRKDWDFANLSERLDGYPLAISQVANVIIMKGYSVTEYLHRFDELYD